MDQNNADLMQTVVDYTTQKFQEAASWSSYCTEKEISG